MSLSNTTELEAINIMLTTIGEAPVNSVDDAGLSDVGIARQILKEVSREVQARTWHFNTEVNYTLTPTHIEGDIVIPFAVLRVDTVGDSTKYDVAVRGNRLYDKRNHTFVFKEAVTVDMVVLLEWNDLPEPARIYITTRASREFQRRMVGSSELEGFNQERELRNLIALQEFDMDTGDYNILTDNPVTTSILWR